MEMYYGNEGVSRYLKIELGTSEQLRSHGYGYHVHMLENNSISHLLCPCMVSTDGKLVLRYETDSYYVLARMLRSVRVDGDLFLRILSQIGECVDALAQYLLTPNHLVLSPEYMFYNSDTNELKLVYAPGYCRDLREQLRLLFEYMMPMFEPEDKRGIQNLYSLYAMLDEEMPDIAALLQTVSKKQEDISKRECEEIPEEVFEYRIEEKKYPNIRLSIGILLLLLIESGTAVFSLIKIVFSDSRLLWAYLFIGSLAMIAVLCVCCFTGIQENDNEAMAEYSAVQSEAFSGYADDFLEMGIPPEQLGELSGSDISCANGKDVSKPDAIRALVPLSNGALREVELACYGDKIVIGRGRAETDYRLQATEISRIHACIYKKEEGLYIEDRNSTNGTYLNSVRIPSNEITKLNRGDILGFANEEFFVS